jgi:hypothetical protein
MFVAASIVAIVVKNLRQAPGNATSAGQTAAEEQTVADGVIAYYMHGAVRCKQCSRIEEYAGEAIEKGFPEELDTKKLHWCIINYDEPGSEHWVTDYQLVAPSLVLVRMSAGSQTQWKSLPEVWELVGDKSAFIQFVQKNVRTFLDGSTEAKP